TGALFAAAAWLRLGEAPARRLARSLVAVGGTVAIVLTTSVLRMSWDASEGRLNSFPEAAEEALERINQPVRIEAHLAPGDPRRVDLERHAFAKLRRTIPGVGVSWVSRTTTGLFEQSDAAYGEIRYSVGANRVVGRATTDEAVLEAIFDAAGIELKEEDE